MRALLLSFALAFTLALPVFGVGGERPPATRLQAPVCLYAAPSLASPCAVRVAADSAVTLDVWTPPATDEAGTHYLYLETDTGEGWAALYWQ